MEKEFGGVYAAMFSVYDEQMNVKKDTVKKLVDFYLDNGLRGFYVGGNTGECTVLPMKTRKQMLEAVVEANRGRGQIIAHIGAGHYDETMDLLEHADSLDIDAISSLPPSLTAYYDEDETYEYYKAIAEKSKHPVFAYIASQSTGDLLRFAKRIADIPNIKGLKISISDYYAFGQVKAIGNGRFTVFNGPDETLVCGLAEGADGAIGTSYSIVPSVAVELYESMKRGDNKRALEMQRFLNEYIGLALSENLAYWKAMLECMGFDMGYTVFPARSVSETEYAELKTKIAGLEARRKDMNL